MESQEQTSRSTVSTALDVFLLEAPDTQCIPKEEQLYLCGAPHWEGLILAVGYGGGFLKPSSKSPLSCSDKRWLRSAAARTNGSMRMKWQAQGFPRPSVGCSAPQWVQRGTSACSLLLCLPSSEPACTHRTQIAPTLRTWIWYVHSHSLHMVSPL